MVDPGRTQNRMTRSSSVNLTFSGRRLGIDLVAEGGCFDGNTDDSATSKFPQVLGDQHFAREMFLHIVDPRRVVVIGLCCEMSQDHRLDARLRRHLADVLRAEMSLGHLALDAGSLGGGHYLPLTGL